MNISGPAAVAKPEMLFYAPGDLTVTHYWRHFPAEHRQQHFHERVGTNEAVWHPACHRNG